MAGKETLSNLITLMPGQNKSAKVNDPFPLPHNATKQSLELDLVGFLSGSLASRENIILSHTYLVLNVVGRYTYYWDLAKQFEDDLVSEGLMALMKVVDELETLEDGEWLAYKVIRQSKYNIEKYLNENVSQVSASYSTNRRRSADGQPLELSNQVDVQTSPACLHDDGPSYVDMLDDFESLANTDGEEFIDAVFHCLSRDHMFEPSSLKTEEFNLLKTLVKLAKGDL